MAANFWLGTDSALGGAAASSFSAYYNLPYNPRDFTPPRPLKFVARGRTFDGEVYDDMGRDDEGTLLTLGFQGVQSLGSGYAASFWERLEFYRNTSAMPLYFSWDGRSTIIKVGVLDLQGPRHPTAVLGGGYMYQDVVLTLVRRD